ncbi:MAG: DUF805 domain-containing protein [Agromyces sp.]
MTNQASIPTTAGMTMGQAIRSCFQKYVTFTGRATRSEYWYFALFHALVSAALTIALVVGTLAAFGPFAFSETYMAMPYDRYMASMHVQPIGLVFFALAACAVSAWYLGTVLPGLAVSVRRLHDAGLNGWLFLLVLLPWVGPIIAFVFALLPSVPADNQWGLAPARR